MNDCLTPRTEAGLAIEEIILCNSRFTLENALELRSIVSKVFWDGDDKGDLLGGLKRGQ